MPKFLQPSAIQHQGKIGIKRIVVPLLASGLVLLCILIIRGFDAQQALTRPLFLSATALATSIFPTTGLVGESLKTDGEVYVKQYAAKLDTPCTSYSVRKEWYDLPSLVQSVPNETDHTRSLQTALEKRKYIDAVLCLQELPSKFPAGLVPGAITRYDDFVAIHVNETSNTIARSFSHKVHR